MFGGVERSTYYRADSLDGQWRRAADNNAAARSQSCHSMSVMISKGSREYLAIEDTTSSMSVAIELSRWIAD